MESTIGELAKNLKPGDIVKFKDYGLYFHVRFTKNSENNMFGIYTSNHSSMPDKIISSTVGAWNFQDKIEIISTNHFNLMSSIVNFIKNVGLSKEDKLLMRLGLEDPSGTPTQTGLEAMSQIVYKENRTKLIEYAKQLDAEEKAEKK